MNLLSNTKWNAFSQIFKIICQLANLLYLTRLISSADYGVMAICFVFVNLCNLLRDLGTASAIIQKKELDNRLINAVFWLNIFIGVFLCLILMLFAPLISAFYSVDKLNGALILISFIFPISSLGAAHLSLMERESKFKKISIIEICSSIISLFIAIVLANLGFGVYSLIFQTMTLSIISTSLFWFYSGWKPTILKKNELNRLKEILGFSSGVSGFNFVNFLSRNMDSFLVGRYMSTEALGNYNLAYRIMLFPLQSLTFITNRSLYPILSKNQDDNGYIERIFLSCNFYILAISAPLMSGIAFFSHEIVSYFFSAQWNLTADIIKWLAPVGIIQSVVSSTGAVFMSKGRTSLLLFFGFLGAFLQVSSFIIGVNFDIVSLAFFYLLANILNFLPVMICLMSIIGSNIFRYISKMIPIMLSLIIMITILELFKFRLGDVMTLQEFFLHAMFGLFSYLFSLYILSQEIRELTSRLLFRLRI